MNFSVSDASFPQLSKILDSEFMQKTLQKALFSEVTSSSDLFEIEQCLIGEKRHKPGKHFWLSYSLKIFNLRTEQHSEILLNAHLIPTENLISGENAKMDSQVKLPNGIPAISYFAELAMVLWAFPYDAKLSHLPLLLDQAFLAAYFDEQQAQLDLPVGVKLVSVQTKVMHYLPEVSCMIRFTLDLQENENSGLSQQRVIYGKCFPDSAGIKVYDHMLQLASQSRHCAKPLFYDANLKTLWQASVPGEIFEWVPELIEQKTLIADVAGAIAEFHRCQLQTNDRYLASTIIEHLKTTPKIAAKVNPKLVEPIQACVSKLLDIYQALDWSGSREGPIHLDLKMGNLLVAGRKVTLIDFDCVCLGDPLADTGSFIANLYLNGLRAGATLAHVDYVVDTFRTAYQVELGRQFEAVQLDWYIAAALIHEVVRRSLRQQDHERINLLGVFLVVSDRYAEVCRMELSHA